MEVMSSLMIWTGIMAQHNISIPGGVVEDGDLIALISKKILTFGDAYSLQIARKEDELPVLLVALAVDAAHWGDDN